MLWSIVSNAAERSSDKRTVNFQTHDRIALYVVAQNDSVHKCQQDFGIRGTALSWLQSFVTDRKQYVSIGPAQSAPGNWETAQPEFLRAVSLARCCSSCTFHRSVMSSVLTSVRRLHMAVRPGANVTFIAMSECVNDVARWFPEWAASQPG